MPMEQTVLEKFKINDYLTVKLIDYYGLTKSSSVFVKDEMFIRCAYILLNMPKDNIELTHEINSIDEAAEKLDHKLEYPFNDDLKIPAETLFWAHCSNLQAWAENGYDTRLLHRNIAFPLLKKLTDVGDKTAKRKFKEEIAKKYESGYENVQKYLLKEGYLDYLTEDELESIGLDTLTVKFSPRHDQIIARDLWSDEFETWISLEVEGSSNGHVPVLEIDFVEDHKKFFQRLKIKKEKGSPIFNGHYQEFLTLKD